MEMGSNNKVAANAIPVYVLAGPPVTGDRANHAKSIPVWTTTVAPPGVGSGSSKAVPIYYTTSPPVTGDRANLQKAAPIYVFTTPPVIGDRAITSKAMPAYLVAQPT
jgi:hypothetical protein